ncbi:unnamed protein product [Paramecium primaurelia]|uniref:Uncharacterized protein n=1 Tax=Paramecium primaurelia TaxID=5886 RepID=A0A8S1MES0_PARPR|nr:unnamed protein product [Paramecium primaurelia]
MKNIKNYRVNKVALNLQNQDKFKSFNQFITSLKTFDRVIYNHYYQREIRIKTEQQESLVSKATFKIKDLLC